MTDEVNCEEYLEQIKQYPVSDGKPVAPAWRSGGGAPIGICNLLADMATRIIELEQRVGGDDA